MSPEKMNPNEERTIDAVLQSLESQCPAEAKELGLQVRSLSEEERSLEARLDRALTPEMKGCLMDALLDCADPSESSH